MAGKTNEKGFTKTYIGKGTQVEGLDIVRVSVKLTEAVKSAHIYNGELYLTFEVAKLQVPDNFGKTHTCYFSQKEKQEEENA